ncbi:hypothetical protein NM688_g5477 [Phlebia brevispora]|uniref:Uncharacterized protein n=1 Tax=Phlebia brevispora TaxID=194682 RepID=A0ACC1SUS8_9APHY|nr:hypothetical protein NM688_g5477 [Phlebia brevispora]
MWNALLVPTFRRVRSSGNVCQLGVSRKRDPISTGSEKLYATPFMTTQGTPLSALPAYTATQSLLRQPRRQPVVHTYELKDGKGRPWLTLNVSSRAPNPSCLPHFYEGDAVNGVVSLDLEKEMQIKSVTAVVHGEIIATHNVRYTFLRLAKELWSLSKNPPSTSSRHTTNDSSSKSKISGRFQWPFSLALPAEVQLEYRRMTQSFRLPSSFYVRGARVTVRYQVYAVVGRGKLQVDNEVGTQVVFTPIIRPEPPSLARQLSYQEKTPLVGPEDDPEGWHRVSPVVLRGSIFNNRAVEAQLTLWLAKPLCYTRGSVVPLVLEIQCDDPQALDILSSPRSPQIRLNRTLSMGYDADWGRAGHSTRQINLCEDSTATTSSGDLADDLQTAVWWEPTRDRSERPSNRHVLCGEVHLSSSLPPSSQLGYFSVLYNVALYPSQAVAFTASSSKKTALCNVPVVIATVYPRCPRPVAYSPPDYASLHSDGTESRVYDAIVYGLWLSGHQTSLVAFSRSSQTRENTRPKLSLAGCIYFRVVTPAARVYRPKGVVGWFKWYMCFHLLPMNLPPFDSVVAEASDLPAYSSLSAHAADFTTRALVEHSYALDDKKDGSWFTLKISSRASSPSSLPLLVEGDPIVGSVSLALVKEAKIKSISISVVGELVLLSSDAYIFAEVTEQLWQPGKGHLHAVGEATTQPTSDDKGKICGSFCWPFSIELPRTVELKHGELQQYQLPASYSERGARVSIHYRITATVIRGLLSTEYAAGTNAVYIPRIQPDPPSPARQNAYLVGTPLLGPEDDPDGWHTLPSLTIRGKIFDVREVEVTCTLSFAKPLCYTRGSNIPLWMALESQDSQVLDLLSTTRATNVRLRRVFHLQYDFLDPMTFGKGTKIADLKATPNIAFRDTTVDVQSATWRPQSRMNAGEGSQKAGTRVLQGELPLKAVPLTVISHGSLPNFPDSMKVPLQTLPLEIATVYSSGPRPLTYLTAQAVDQIPNEFAVLVLFVKATMSSRAGGLYGGIQFSSSKAFITPSVPQVPTPAASTTAATEDANEQPQATPAQPIETAANVSTTADSGASVKASAGISSYSTAFRA